VTELTRTERLASAILADRDRPSTQHNILPCFACGHTFVYRGRRGGLYALSGLVRCRQ
jgi:hypothetical protein